MKKFFTMTENEFIAPPDTEIIYYLRTPWSLPPWITEEDLKFFAEKFEESSFTGPLNYFRAMDL